MKSTYLDLSTGHLTKETMEQLINIGRDPEVSADMLQDCGWPAMTVAVYDHGVFVTVPEFAEQPQWDALPKDLLAVIDYTIDGKREANITLLRFDSDGDQLDGLPFYEW